MILMHRALHKDSKTSIFANLRIFYEFLLNFKVHCKNYKGVPRGTIHMCPGLFKQPPGVSLIQQPSPWPMGKNRAGFGRPLPAPRLTGGEVWVGGNEEEAETNPKVLFLGVRGGRIGGSPRRGAAAAWVARRRPFCGGGLGWGRCLGDAQYSCGANGGVCGGGSGLKWWVRGGVKLAGVQVDGGGALRSGERE